MGHDHLFRPHGHIALLILGCQYSRCEHRLERDGVLFPEYVQCDTIWMDTRSIPSANSRYSIWAGQLLGSCLQHRIPLDRRTSPD